MVELSSPSQMAFSIYSLCTKNPQLLIMALSTQYDSRQRNSLGLLAFNADRVSCPKQCRNRIGRSNICENNYSNSCILFLTVGLLLDRCFWFKFSKTTSFKDVTKFVIARKLNHLFTFLQFEYGFYHS